MPLYKGLQRYGNNVIDVYFLFILEKYSKFAVKSI